MAAVRLPQTELTASIKIFLGCLLQVTERVGGVVAERRGKATGASRGGRAKRRERTGAPTWRASEVTRGALARNNRWIKVTEEDGEEAEEREGRRGGSAWGK